MQCTFSTQFEFSRKGKCIPMGGKMQSMQVMNNIIPHFLLVNEHIGGIFPLHHYVNSPLPCVRTHCITDNSVNPFFTHFQPVATCITMRSKAFFHIALFITLTALNIMKRWPFLPKTIRRLLSMRTIFEANRILSVSRPLIRIRSLRSLSLFIIIIPSIKIH